MFRLSAPSAQDHSSTNERVVPRGGPEFSRERRSGFSLIDLVLLVALTTMLVVLFTPSFQSALHRAKSAGFAQQLELTLQQARSEAMKTHSPVCVSMSGDALIAAAGGETLASATLPPRIRFQTARGFGGAGAVRFLSDGSVDRAGAFRFVDSWNNRLEVAVEPQASGRIEVRKRNRSGRYVAEGAGGEAWNFD